MSGRTLTSRALNRALLARQLLLERSSMSMESALEQVGGLQTQYSPSGYVGLWTRLATFQRADLTAALDARTVVQATLMRVTIHLVSTSDFWRYAMGLRKARRAWALRVAGPEATESDAEEGARAVRAALAVGPRDVKELGGLAAGFIGNLAPWLDLVRVPPSGTWERRRADRLALAEDWIGPSSITEEEGLGHVVQAYLRAFGPAPWRDIAGWAGITAADAARAGASIDLVHHRDADGRDLVDLPGAELPDEGTPAPVRFLAHFDANLLVHARRTGILPEAYRPLLFNTRNPFSMGAYLVDGVVAGGWSFRDGRIVLAQFADLPAKDLRAVEREREALEAFHA